jgi:hypothetical protein
MAPHGSNELPVEAAVVVELHATPSDRTACPVASGWLLILDNAETKKPGCKTYFPLNVVAWPIQALF